MSNAAMQEPMQNLLDDFRPLFESLANYEKLSDDSSAITTDELRGGGLPQASDRDTWSEHEEFVYEIIKKAAELVCVATRSNIIVTRPKQSYIYSKNGALIKPDVMITIKYKKTMYTTVVDAKNHSGDIPTKDYEKLLRDMAQVNAGHGVLFLNENGRLNGKIQERMKNDSVYELRRNSYDNDTAAPKTTAELLGGFIEPNFKLSKDHYRQIKYVQSSDITKTIENALATSGNKTTMFDFTHYSYVRSPK